MIRHSIFAVNSSLEIPSNNSYSYSFRITVVQNISYTLTSRRYAGGPPTFRTHDIFEQPGPLFSAVDHLTCFELLVRILFQKF